MLRLMGLPNVARYPEATVTREDERLIINFGGCDYAQTMGVPLKYVNARDVETAELMLLAQLQQIGYRTRRGPPNA
ncbi:MAG: hypothetical protein M3274_06400 [Actinomycetota bacterium]|nr:hypothetical protein [Actinomycetota bacterium]